MQIVDYEKILKAIEETIQKLQAQEYSSNTAIEKFENAKQEIKQAMEYSLSSRLGRYY